MSDDVDKPESSASEAQGPRGGERLAEARREQQIAIIEIAKELHLDEHKVRSLERNEFEVLGAPVFAKGYLKKYAQLVHVDADDVLADYYHMNRTTDVPPVVPTRSRPRQELSPGPWIAVIIVIALAVTAYLWFVRQEAPSAGIAESAPAQADAGLAPSEADEAVAPQGIDDALQQDADSEVPEADAIETRVLPRPAEPPAESLTEAPVEETSSPEIADGQVRVLLTYTGDCWTEVTDATGRRLFFDLGRDGRSVELSGAEPLNVLFGSPANVQVVVNGEDFALPATARPDRPMRLTLSGS